jgi:hypothetical protein
MGRRRHAHTACVRTARAAGRLPSRDEWRATQPPSRLARLFGRRYPRRMSDATTKPPPTPPKPLPPQTEDRGL